MAAGAGSAGFSSLLVSMPCVSEKLREPLRLSMVCSVITFLDGSNRGRNFPAPRRHCGGHRRPADSPAPAGRRRMAERRKAGETQREQRLHGCLVLKPGAPSLVKPQNCRLPENARAQTRRSASKLPAHFLLLMLTIRDLRKTVGGRTLFENASMQVNYGERVALVGPNGAGKSTLFSLILKRGRPRCGRDRARRLDHDRLPTRRRANRQARTNP